MTTLQTTMIRPADDLGPVLTSRSLAEALRQRVEAAAVREEVVIDFAGVEAVSPSFADEIFAKLPRELVESGRVRFENMDEDLQSLAEFVVASRAAI
jgi:hypothetical protein